MIIAHYISKRFHFYYPLLGYLEQGLLVRDAKKLRQHYFSTSHWRLDLVSMFPTDLAYLWWGPNQCNFDRVPCAVIVRINRLLRLPRMWEWFERTETATGYPNAFRICKVSSSWKIFSSEKLMESARHDTILKPSPKGLKFLGFKKTPWLIVARRASQTNSIPLG